MARTLDSGNPYGDRWDPLPLPGNKKVGDVHIDDLRKICGRLGVPEAHFGAGRAVQPVMFISRMNRGGDRRRNCWIATARRIAVNIAKLPELLGRHRTWGVRRLNNINRPVEPPQRCNPDPNSVAVVPLVP
jgi:hypothetical protein